MVGGFASIPRTTWRCCGSDDGEPLDAGERGRPCVAPGRAEAIAVTLWLLPASVHIVNWPPAAGAARLAVAGVAACGVDGRRCGHGRRSVPDRARRRGVAGTAPGSALAVDGSVFALDSRSAAAAPDSRRAVQVDRARGRGGPRLPAVRPVSALLPRVGAAAPYRLRLEPRLLPGFRALLSHPRTRRRRAALSGHHREPAARRGPEDREQPPAPRLPAVLRRRPAARLHAARQTGRSIRSMRRACRGCCFRPTRWPVTWARWRSSRCWRH